MNLDELARILESADPFPPLVVMEYLPGDEYDVDVLALKGKSLCVIPRRNQSMWYGMSLICTTEPHTEIMMMSEQIVASLGLSYVVSLSFKLDAEGHAKIIEINPRIPGSIISATMAGVNMPYLAVKLALGESIEIPPVQWGRQMIRYWEEMFVSPEGELLKPISSGPI
jgi:carbamoyl-phosphate synthase large subunit